MKMAKWVDAEDILRENLKQDILQDNGEADENTDADQRLEMWKRYKRIAEGKSLVEQKQEIRRLSKKDKLSGM
jgi:hypothetical protein